MTINNPCDTQSATVSLYRLFIGWAEALMIPAKLVLATGDTFHGQAPSWQQGHFFGEVVFNTGMVGYPEAMTDPSYAGQLLVFTYPLIGNYGVPDASTWESDKIQVAGIVVSEAAEFYSHRDGKRSLLDWCRDEGIPVIAGIDTRQLAKTLSQQGVIAGAITEPDGSPTDFPDINKEHWVAKLSIDEPQDYGQGDKTIIAIDCGMKNNILRHLQTLPVKIRRVPYNYDFTHEAYDAVFISNGPGDPAQCDETVDILKKVLSDNKPVFGICLGAQLMARAIGAITYKLPFGHRAQNHPCLHIPTGQCYLTSQNHGFAIEESSLPEDWTIIFRHLNDHTIQGIQHKSKPFFSVQFHPEAAPGPVDTAWLFGTFHQSITERTT